MTEVKILTFSSSATATPDSHGNVLISGSYGGEYNAYHAAKWGIRGVVLNDAGVGSGRAGIVGLNYLDRVGLPAAAADVWSCHIADGEDMLANGIISFVNKTAAALGCLVGETVSQCAESMKAAPVCDRPPPEIKGGKRYVMRDEPGARKIVCLDAAPMLLPEDAGAVAVTGSHAALFRGRSDGVIGPDVFAVFFSDAGLGKDGAGITRLPTLDERGIISATVSAQSAPIGDSRAIYKHGVISYVNEAARAIGARPGVLLRDVVDRLSDGTASGKLA